MKAHAAMLHTYDTRYEESNVKYTIDAHNESRLLPCKMQTLTNSYQQYLYTSIEH